MKRTLQIAVCLICLAAATPLWAQKAEYPRAKSPLLLFSFEGDKGASGWTGLYCRTTTEHASDGVQSMTVTFPQHKSGEGEWRTASIDWNDGKGYATKDFSHYAKLAFDVWVYGDNKESIGIDLRDKPGRRGNGQEFPVLPGVKNSIEVPLADLSHLDLANIRQIAISVMKPAETYTLAIDNIRLLPGERLPFASLELSYPNYRGTVFPNAKSIRVDCSIESKEYGIRPSDVRVVLTATSPRTLVSNATALTRDHSTVALPTAQLAAGPIRLTASVVKRAGGKVLATRSWDLRKITPAEVKSLKVYIDENNNTIADGKPFFPLGWYSNATVEHMEEIAQGPFNCILDYHVSGETKQAMLDYMDKVQAKGLKLIYCMNDIYPTATYYTSWEGITGNERIADAVVEAYKNHPALLAWYTNDELPVAMVPRLEGYYRQVAKGDPTHPTYIVLCTMPEVKYFADTTDIMGVDPYPVPSRPVRMVADWTDDGVTATSGHKPVWAVLQAYARYQHSSVNKDRSHIPTPEELSDGRGPTFEEQRCMTYLALTHGAKGIIYWCYYNMRKLPQYEQMWGWMKTIGSEVQNLSPMLLSPDDLGEVRYAPSTGTIHTKLKKYNGRLYLMAVNDSSSACSITFDLGKPLSGRADVMFEKRTVKTAGTKLTDSFKPLEVHVYSLGKGASRR